MLLTGLIAGSAAAYGTFKYVNAQKKSQDNLDAVREQLRKQGVIEKDTVDRLIRYESTYGNTYNNVLLDKLNPNSIIRSNRKSHKLFKKTREKIKELEEKKVPYENEMEFREKELDNGFTDIETATPIDTYKPGKYVVGYDYLKDTPNYMISTTNTIFGHMHFGLKKEMNELRDANANKSETDRTMKKGTIEYELLVDSQKDIEASRTVKNEVLKGHGFFSKIGKYATKRFGNLSDSGRALKRHNTLKKRVKRNAAMYQADSLKAYRKLYSSLADEKDLLDAKSEDVVKKFDDIFFEDAKEIEYKKVEGQKEATGIVESNLAFDPMQINLDYADENGKLNIVSHNNNNQTMSNYKTYSNLYLRLVKSTHNMREGKGDNYGEIIQLIKDYGNMMDGGRLEKCLPMCHSFFRTGTMRRAMSAGLVAGSDSAEKLSEETKRTLDFARVMLTQCITQLMFDTVNNNPNLFVNLEAFGKLSANYQLSKLAASALMNRTDFLQTVSEEGKKEAEKDQLRLKAGSEYCKKLMRDDIGDKDADKYDKYIDSLLSAEVNNDSAYRDIVESIKNIGANYHTENLVKKEVVKSTNDEGQEVTTTKFILDKDFEKKCKDSHQIKDGYNRLIKPMLANFGDKRGLIRMYVEKFCKDKTLGLGKIEDKLVETIEDKLGADMLVASWWTPMVLGYQEETRKEDNIGKLEKDKEKGKNKEVERAFKPLVGDDLLGALTTHFAHLVPTEILDEKVETRCTKFKDAIVSTLQKQGGNCVFDIEKLWMNDQKIAKLLSDDGQDSDKNFDDYIKTMTQTLSNNISMINNRTQVVANSFVFNSRRNKVYDYIGANIFTGGVELIKTLTDYAIDRIMQEALTDKATETLEKNVEKALDISVLENRWKISSMTALNAKLLAKGEDPASYTVEKLVQLFNDWNDTFTLRSNQIVTLYQGIYMSPAQIEKEMDFFDENAWMEEEDFKAVVNQHIEEFKKAGILKTEKGKTDVSIDGFLETMTNREKAYEIQPITDIEELFREEITTNPAYTSVFKNLMGVKDLFNLMKKSVKKGDASATTILSLNADELNKLSIAQYGEVKEFIEGRLLPLAKYLDTVPAPILTNVVRDKCIERAMKGELELMSVETLVNEELEREENREQINKKRSFIALSGEGTDMGALNVDNSRMPATKKGQKTRTENSLVAANFWKKMWETKPDMAKAITIAFDRFNSEMQALRERKIREHLIDRKKEYTNAKFHKDYDDELKRFVKKLTDADEPIKSNSDICNTWYKSLPLSKEVTSKKPGDNSELKEAVKEFIGQVRTFVKDNHFKVDDLLDARNEFGLMGNADILLSVGEKYENTVYKPQDEYEEDIHNIINRMMKTPYVTYLVEQRDQLGNIKKDAKPADYAEVKKVRQFLLGTKSDETSIKRRILFGNVDSLAQALLEAGREFEANERTVAKIFGADPDALVERYRGNFAELKKKSAEFNAALKMMDQYNDGAEEDLITKYKEFFAEIEKVSKNLVKTRESAMTMNAKYAKEAQNEEYPGMVAVNRKDTSKKSYVELDEVKFVLGNESFILGVENIVRDSKEAINGIEMIKNLFGEIRVDQEENLHRFGAKNSYDAYVHRYAFYKGLTMAAKLGDEGAVGELNRLEQIKKNYDNNCNRLRANDAKVGVMDRMSIFIPAMKQDDRFIELMTETGAEAEKEIDKYIEQFKGKVATFLQAITENGEYIFDMATVIPQFIEHHKDDLLKGSEVFTTAKEYKQELQAITNAWMSRKSGGKSANDVKKSAASKELPVTTIEKEQIVSALMHEGTVSVKSLSDAGRLEVLIKEYKRRWDANMNTLKTLPSYKKLEKISQNGTTNKDAKVSDLLVSTFRDKIITLSEEDLVNLASTYAERALEINKSRAIKADAKDVENWDYVKERKIREDINRGQVRGRNALAEGNAAIRKASDCYYNGVSILSNAKKSGEKQKLTTADEMEKNREKVRLKIEAIKAKKGEGVAIKKEDLDILTELYSTGNVWDSFPLLWNSNIGEAYDSLVNLRDKVKKAVEEDRKEKKGKTGLNDGIAEHDINRFILFMAAHGRLNYEGGADGFVVRKSKDLWHWFKSTFGVGAQDIQQEYKENDLSVAQMFESYGHIQSEIDNFTAEGLNIKSQSVIDQCNSERIALQMAMFSMDEIKFNDLKDERKTLLLASDDIQTIVTDTIKSNKALNQSSKELENVIEVLTRGFIDYYGEDIKKLIPVRKEGDQDVKVLTEKQITAERKRITAEIKNKLSGKDVMYYIKSFTEADKKLSAEERTLKGPITKSREVSVDEFEGSIKKLGDKREKRYAAMSEGEKKAIALIISQPFRFLATDRVGAINMVMDHDKVTDAYFHKMYYVEENRSNAAAIDIVNLISPNKIVTKDEKGNEIKDEIKIDYSGAYARLAGIVGTKGGKEIFDQAVELLELCKERVDFYKTREWDNIDDPEKSIKLAGLLGKSKANSKEARNLKSSKNQVAMKAALAEMVSSSTKTKLENFKNDNLGILVTLLQNRSILDESTVVGKEGMAVNSLMREQVVKDLCLNSVKKAEYQENANKQMYISKAIMTLLSYQVRDDVKLENGVLKTQDILESSLNRSTVIDEKLLVKAIDMANAISELVSGRSTEKGNMSIEEFNDSYNTNEILSGKKKQFKHSNDLDGILANVNSLLKSQSVQTEFSVFKNQAGEKAKMFRQGLYETWSKAYASRKAEVDKLGEADKIAFEKAKAEIDKMVLPINKNDEMIKTDKITA